MAFTYVKQWTGKDIWVNAQTGVVICLIDQKDEKIKGVTNYFVNILNGMSVPIKCENKEKAIELIETLTGVKYGE